MIPTGPALRDMLVDLYGRRDWLHRAADEIGVTRRAVQGWTSGAHRPRANNAAKIRLAVARQLDRVAAHAVKCGLE